MLEVRNLNKYYNKNSHNEIHVINNANFVLGDKGLVSILGHSGSGKTTLLNSLCGIDKVNSGEIIINGISIKEYNATLFDNIRNKYFGYIFQNYNLNNNLTVFENVALSLKLLGMKNTSEIEERTMHALRIVKMDKYRNRLAKNLSGGQMQRVSIARAIVKDAKIILADEATGNLDRKNTVIIMSILREIANERLVVMVTHERELAYAYSDRILEIQDGKIINDVENDALSSEYSYDDENIIHLGDYDKEELANDENSQVTRYNVNEIGNVKIDFIVKDNQVFVSTSSPMRVRIVDDKSLVKFDYGKKEDFTTPLIDKEEVSIKPIDKSKLKSRYSVNYFKTAKESLVKLATGRALKTFILMAFTISAFFLTLSIGLLRGFGTIDESKFMKSNRDLVEVEIAKVSRSTFEKIYKEINERDDVYNIVSSFRDVLISTTLYEGNPDNYTENVQTKALIQPISLFNIDSSLTEKLDSKSVIIDQCLVDYLIKEYGAYFQTTNAILNQKIIINSNEYKIVGVTNNNNFNIYCLDNVADTLNIESTEIKLVDSLKPTDYTVMNGYTFTGLNDGEIILNASAYRNYASTGKYNLYGTEYRIKKGVYLRADDAKASYALTLNDAKLNEMRRMFSIVGSNPQSLGRVQMYVYTSDYKQFIKDYADDIVVTKSEYNNSRIAYEQMYAGITLTISIISAIIFIAPLIMLYFLMRSSTISKIREIAINRSLGMRNSSAILEQFYEITTIISVFALPGYLASIIFMIITNGVFINYGLDIITLLLSLAIIFGIIVFVGLIPILRIVKKVPQKMLTKYDI